MELEYPTTPTRPAPSSYGGSLSPTGSSPYRKSPAHNTKVVSKPPPQITSPAFVGLVAAAVVVVSILVLYFIGSSIFSSPSQEVSSHDEPSHPAPSPVVRDVGGTIKLDQNFDQWDEAKRKAFLNELADVLGKEVEVVEVRRGSVILDLKLDAEQAKLLEDPAVQRRLNAKFSTDPADPQVQPSNYQAVPNQQTEETSSDQVMTLHSGDHVDVDFGLYARATLSGVVFHDRDADGTYTPREDEYLASVKVRLIKVSGVQAAETWTDKNGKFGFLGAEPGEYYISVLAPEKFHFSPQFTSEIPLAADRIVSHVGQASGNTSLFTLVATKEKIQSINAGLYQLATIAGVIREDNNADGKIDQYTDKDEYIPVINFALMASDSKQVQLASLQTSASSRGEYRFTDLKPGSYVVQATIPPPWKFSPRWNASRDGYGDYSDFFINGQSSDAIVRSGSTAKVNLALYRPVIVQGLVFEDLDAQGVVSVEVSDPQAAATALPSRCVSGARIALVSEARGGEVATTSSGGQGTFQFLDVTPGVYSLQAYNPPSYKSSPIPRGLKNRIEASRRIFVNMADPTGHRIDEIQLNSGQVYHDAVFGMYTMAIIEGTVWDDRNANGKMDNNEPGLENVSVHLETVNGETKASTKTDSNGRYSFEVDPGKYRAPKITKPSEDYHSSVNAKIRWQHGKPADHDDD